MNSKEKIFVAKVWDFYRVHGRHNLPWRKTKNPYRILVSELMLQQTQVERVVPKYKAFLKQFPTIAILAESSLAEVLQLWQGLGYNRRAKFLWLCAQEIKINYDGVFPHEYAQLLALPGVGPYTAAAISVFAFNTPVPLIETNVRSVYLTHFFTTSTNVTDVEILKVVTRTMSIENPREWFAALMDYGSYLKKTNGNINTVKSASYSKQSTFKGSDREIRGEIIRLLLNGPLTMSLVRKQASQPDFERIKRQLQMLCTEGLVVKTSNQYHLPN